MTLLTDIPGVGPSIAEAIRSNGYSTAEAVAHANLLRICETEGVGPETVLEAQRLIDERYKNAWNRKKFEKNTPNAAYCSKCGRKYTTYSQPSLAVHERDCDGPDPTPSDWGMRR